MPPPGSERVIRPVLRMRLWRVVDREEVHQFVHDDVVDDARWQRRGARQAFRRRGRPSIGESEAPDRQRSGGGRL